MSAESSPSDMFAKRTLQTVTERRCCRGFLATEVEEELIEDILKAVRHVPSSQNTQPWQVVVVRGAALQALSAALLSAFESTPAADVKPDYKNRPAQLPAAEQQRLADYGRSYYAALQVAREDAAARRAIERRNYTFFGAPVHLILHTTASAVEGTFLDCGIFLGTLLHAAAASGLGACPQFSIAKFGHVVRRLLALSDDRLVVCGISLGYPDPAASINSFKPRRADLSEWVTARL